MSILRGSVVSCSLGNICLVQIATVSHYTGDANQNRPPRWQLQKSFRRGTPRPRDTRAAPCLRRASALSAGCQRHRSDRGLGLSCGREGGHTGATCAGTDWQADYRWGAVAAPSAAADGVVRTDPGCGAPTQGEGRPTSGSLLSRTAVVRAGWQSIFGDQHAAGQETDAQSQESPGPGG